MALTTPPRVFVSHATEDKERFVIGFATKLRANGIDAWVDQWELLPGDSLIDKIFEEGIKNAAAFVIVLSKTSVAKAWVREELNAAVIKRISGTCRVIPVVLDDCEVPECLKATLWQQIPRLDDYSAELQRIVNAIHGLSDKPELGNAPSHTDRSPLIQSSSLQKLDLLVFETLCDESTRTCETYVTSLECLEPLLETGITEDELHDSLMILDEEGYVSLSRVMSGGFRGTGVSHLSIPTAPFDEYARAKWPEYESVLERLVSGLVNREWRSAQDIESLQAPERLRDHLVRLLEDSGHIRVSRHSGGFSIYGVSPKLKRAIQTG